MNFIPGAVLVYPGLKDGVLLRSGKSPTLSAFLQGLLAVSVWDISRNYLQVFKPYNSFLIAEAIWQLKIKTELKNIFQRKIILFDIGNWELVLGEILLWL